jgi:hypothetical protein
VRAASFSSHGLISGQSDATAARPAGTASPEPGGPGAREFIASHGAWRPVVDEEFLSTVGIPLLSGRHLRASDTQGTLPVAVISPTSPLALTAAALIMLTVSLLAAFVPVHRASRVDPAIALRAE